jgi:hypothetical protein
MAEAPAGADGGAVTDVEAAAAGTRTTSAPATAGRDTSAGTRLLLACGIAGPVAFWGLGLLAMASWPGYDVVADSISGLVYAPEGWLQVDAFVLLAVLTAAFAVGMGRVAGATPADRARVRSALLVLAVIELGFALFPTDAGHAGNAGNAGDAASLHGTAHMLVLGTFAIAFPILGFRIAAVLRCDPPWWRAGILTYAVSVVMAISIVGVALVVAGPLDAWTGLLERVWVAVPSLWLAGLAVHGLLVSAGRFATTRP